jgi:hypothetical protein
MRLQIPRKNALTHAHNFTWGADEDPLMGKEASVMWLKQLASVSSANDEKPQLERAR